MKKIHIDWLTLLILFKDYGCSRIIVNLHKERVWVTGRYIGVTDSTLGDDRLNSFILQRVLQIVHFEFGFLDKVNVTTFFEISTKNGTWDYHVAGKVYHGKIDL